MPRAAQVGAQPVEEVAGRGERLPGEQPVQPVQVGLAGQVRADLAVPAAGLADPRRHPVGGHRVHRRRPDQHADRLAADQDGVCSERYMLYLGMLM